MFSLRRWHLNKNPKEMKKQVKCKLGEMIPAKGRVSTEVLRQEQQVQRSLRPVEDQLNRGDKPRNEMG